MKTAENLKRSFYEQNRIRYCLFLALTICDGLANLVVSVLLKEITDAATAGSLEEWSRKVDDETEKRGLLSEKDKNQSTRTRACLTQRRKKLMEGMA